MLLFGLAALAVFLCLAHRRAEAIRLRVERRRVDLPTLPWEDAPHARPAGRRPQGL